MEETFNIDVIVDGKELSFEARLAAYGYTHRFYVTIYGIEVIYEPDEERNYRAIVDVGIAIRLKEEDKKLIEAVAERLQSLR